MRFKRWLRTTSREILRRMMGRGVGQTEDDSACRSGRTVVGLDDSSKAVLELHLTTPGLKFAGKASVPSGLFVVEEARVCLGGQSVGKSTQRSTS